MDYMFETPSGIVIERETTVLDYHAGIEHLIDRLDRERGAFLSSNVEDPDRYARWDMAFAAPPLEFVGRGRSLVANPLNERGVRLLEILRPRLASAPATREVAASERRLELEASAGSSSRWRRAIASSPRRSVASSPPCSAPCGRCSMTWPPSRTASSASTAPSATT
jgi:anthranilate synthase